MRLFSSLIFIAILNLTFVSIHANAETLDEMTVFIITDEQGDQLDNVLKTVPLFGKVLGEIEVGRTLAIHHTDGKSIVYYRGKNFVFNQNTNILKFSIEASDYELRITESKLVKSSQNSKSREMYLKKVYQSENMNKSMADELQSQLSDKKAELENQKTLNQKLSKTIDSLNIKYSELLLERSSNVPDDTPKFDFDTDPRVVELRNKTSKTISELESLSSSLIPTINYQKEEIENLKSKLVSFENSKSSNENQLEEYKVQIAELEKEISLKVDMVQELEAKLTTKNASLSEVNRNEVNELKTRLEIKTQEVDELNKKLEGLENRITELKKKNEEISEELAEAQTITHSENDIKPLNEKIELLNGELRKTKLALQQEKDRNIQLSQAVSALASSDKIASQGIVEEAEKKLKTSEEEVCFSVLQENLINPETLKIYEFEKISLEFLKEVHGTIKGILDVRLLEFEMDCINRGLYEENSKNACVLLSSMNDEGFDEFLKKAGILNGWIDDSSRQETYFIRYKAESKAGVKKH